MWGTLGSTRASRVVADAASATSTNKLLAQRTAPDVSSAALDTAREARALPITRALSRDFRKLKFNPLPGSGVEATNVAKLLGNDAVLRLGAEAREGDLKTVDRKSVV